MRILIIFLFFVGCQAQVNDELSKKVQDTYTLNKGKEFSCFRNWNIFLREGSKEAYVFDYNKNDQTISRFLIAETGDSVVYKQIFPDQDTLFRCLKADTLCESEIITLNHYLDFKSLKVDALSYIEKNDLFLIEVDDQSLIYSIKALESLSDISRFSSYNKIDEHWFYYKKLKK